MDLAVPTTLSVASQWSSQSNWTHPKHHLSDKNVKAGKWEEPKNIFSRHDSDQEDNNAPDFESDSDLEFMGTTFHCSRPERIRGTTTTTYYSGGHNACDKAQLVVATGLPRWDKHILESLSFYTITANICQYLRLQASYHHIKTQAISIKDQRFSENQHKTLWNVSSKHYKLLDVWLTNGESLL